jgi:predicted nuclease of predicted toxin-antitoxin system
MKLLLDMNLSPRWVSFLTDAGWKTVHWSEIGNGSEPDSEIMAYAAKHDYVVLTHDMDFSAILAATHGEKPSVVQIRTENVMGQETGERVVSALRVLEPELEAGALLSVGQQQTRVRLLPIIPKE